MAVDFLLNAPAITAEVADSPLLRHAVQESLANLRLISRTDLDSAAHLARTATLLTSGSAILPVLTDAETDTILASVRWILAADEPAEVHFATIESGQTFEAQLLAVKAGMDLVANYSTLLDDLLGHATFLALLDARWPSRIRSASLRQFPGLIVMGAPQSPVEAAEHLVHEGAHQKFFDLALVLDIIGPNAHSFPKYHPPWRSPTTRWPLEQCFAAFHAYSCLAQLSDEIQNALTVQETYPSLLPFARQRARDIGGWLIGHVEFLGIDGVSLTHQLLGQLPPSPRSPRRDKYRYTDTVVAVPHLHFSAAGPENILVGRRVPPYEFYFLGSDSARVLQLLERPGHIESLVDALAVERRLDRLSAADLASSTLSELTALQLVVPARQETP
ncbi:aKG-HExxH-type peptide beta-hydroxylase [Pseudonocardia humida]|uniref:HEXXH motif-containing protein n=1 Tax=Pseudonocardia humida TaxID=2800819 RepID=A0ABT1A3X6_9PSEU|nr:HEXXH motif-containing putative peptide modification protein [Pseudonocardia humida]MCO1657690.1 hypothetical protein [Pseudonocardia humida]